MLRNHRSVGMACVLGLLAASLAGCSSRRGEQLSQDDYPYLGAPYEAGDARAATYAGGVASTSRRGNADYYGRFAYEYGRDPSYDFYLASRDDGYWDDEYDDYGDYGYPREVAYFYDELDPYGDWYQDAHYGWVWAPEYVNTGWRPYLYGYWVYTDWGWSWVADDPWGSYTYHYGRWDCDASNRWFWIPDDVWAPAWVSWRYGDGWAGWAPLPPQATWGSTYGLRYADDLVLPSRWCFVPESRLTSTRLRTYVAPISRSRQIYRDTRDVTRYAIVQGRPAERGLKPALIERSTRQRIPQYRLVTRERGLKRESIRGRTLVAPMPVMNRGGGRRLERDLRVNRGRAPMDERGLRVNRGRMQRDTQARERQLRDREMGQERDRLDRNRRGQEMRMQRAREQRGEEMRMQRAREQRGQEMRMQREREQRGQEMRMQREREQRGRREERGRAYRERAEQERAQRQIERRQAQQQDQFERRQRAEQAQQAQVERRQAAEQARAERRQAAEEAQFERRRARQAEQAERAQQVENGRREPPQAREQVKEQRPQTERPRRGRSDDEGEQSNSNRGHGRGHGRDR